MNERIYHIDFKKLVTWLTPHLLRKSFLLALVFALTSPVVYLYNFFLINRRSNLYRLKITPQICYIEMALNDKYDADQRRIRIVKPKSYNPVFLYQKSENKPVYLYRKPEATTIYLFQKGETAQFQFDFIVQVPATVAFDINEMMAVIDNYILPDKVYKISIV